MGSQTRTSCLICFNMLAMSGGFPLFLAIPLESCKPGQFIEMSAFINIPIQPSLLLNACYNYSTVIYGKQLKVG